jgi:hypothetical protein
VGGADALPGGPGTDGDPRRAGFFRDEEGIYRGRLGIDATKPFGKAKKFERKKVPGMNEIDLKEYFT